MTFALILTLCLALTLLAATPGPGVFAAVSRTLVSGFWHGIVVSCGIVLGDLFFLSFAILGLAVAAQLMGDVFVVVRILGGAYLIWLGWKMLKAEPTPFNERSEPKSKGFSRDFLSGLVITLGNPKVIIFYAGFLPTFLDIAHITLPDAAIVAGCVTMVIGGVLAVYTFLAAKARRLFHSRKAVKRLNGGAGAVMIGTGLVIATRT